MARGGFVSPVTPRKRSPASNGQLFLAGFAIALRRFSIFFETISSRLRAVFDPVATFSMFDQAFGLFVF